MPVSVQVLPAPQGLGVQVIVSWQPPLPLGSKFAAQVAQVSVVLLVQVTASQLAMSSQVSQVVPSSKLPAGQMQS